MTLQEAKDQAARKWNEHFDFNALYGGVGAGNIKMIHLKSVIDDAMKLYAKEAADKAWEASGEYEYRSNFGKVPTDVPNKETFMKELFKPVTI